MMTFVRSTKRVLYLKVKLTAANKGDKKIFTKKSSCNTRLEDDSDIDENKL